MQFAGILQHEVNRHQRFTLKEVVDTIVDIVRVAVVVLHIGTSLCRIQTQALGTVEFRLCETMLTGTLSYANSTDDTTQDVILLTADANGESIFGTAEEE